MRDARWHCHHATVSKQPDVDVPSGFYCVRKYCARNFLRHMMLHIPMETAEIHAFEEELNSSSEVRHIGIAQCPFQVTRRPGGEFSQCNLYKAKPGTAVTQVSLISSANGKEAPVSDKIRWPDRLRNIYGNSRQRKAT